jgi:formylglycine-generating enzyme required for sulfatase activity
VRVSGRVRLGAIVTTLATAVAAAAMLLTTAVPSRAEKRVALVIGNSAYINVPHLANPVNDARLMADTLGSLGFLLVGGAPQLNLDEGNFRQVMREFSNQLQGADVGLFYYAGHGVQVRGSNYLVPVGANPTREADVDLQMMDANIVLRLMEGSGTKFNLVILDACRNNPFGGRGLRATDSGLAQMRAPEGTLISFATQPGNVAQDGTGGHSPYTEALAQVVRKPGLKVFDAFNEVGLVVGNATGGAQQPWFSTSPIKGYFYFAGPPPALANAPPADSAAQVWAIVQNATSIAVLEDFIRQFGSTIYGSMAQARLEELKKAQVSVVVPPVVAAAQSGPCGGAGAVTISLSRSGAPLSAAEECSLKPKDVFKECATCPEMVVVPAGSFTMGSPPTEAGSFDHENPQHMVTIAREFAVGPFAVTFDEWDACAADGGCNGYRPPDGGRGRGKQPAVAVSWNDAQAYVAWLAKKTGKPYRLLSEAEREYVTRAGTTTPFWWGSSISTSQANYDGDSAYGSGPKGEYRRRTVPVDSFAANPWGLYQVHGNVYDWTEDCHNDTYSGAPTDGSPWTTGDCSRRVVRGGSYFDLPQNLRSAYRLRSVAFHRYGGIGFRVGRALTPVAPPQLQPDPETPEKAVLYEEDTQQGRRYIGSAIWHVEAISPGPGLAPELAIRADVEIPERKMTVTWSLRRNTDKSLPASHTIEIMFKVPADFPGGGIMER